MNTGPLDWVGGEHDFALRLGQLRALQDSTKSGPNEVMMRIVAGTWRVDDIIDTIRLGLVGSGALKPDDARDLVASMVERHPLFEFVPLAQTILITALTGPLDDKPDGDDDDDDEEAEDPAGKSPPPESGGSPVSTEPAP